MIHFNKFVLLRPLQQGSGRWIVEEPLVYISDAGSLYTVPQGFITDLASIPRFLWSIWPPFGRYASAATLHDYFCESDWISRKDGDKVFLEAMKYSNVPVWKRYIIYWGVRLFAITNHII